MSALHIVGQKASRTNNLIMWSLLWSWFDPGEDVFTNRIAPNWRLSSRLTAFLSLDLMESSSHLADPNRKLTWALAMDNSE